MQTWKGRVAVVTGAASGIGRALAERCAQEGMKVVLADIAETELAVISAALKATGAEVLAVPTDVSKRGDVEALADGAFDTFGGVHLLFNNAGVAAGGAAWEAAWNDWEWVIGVNLWGAIHGVKVFTPRMMAQNEPCRIVNTASAAGLVAGGGSAPYGVSKHAVVALTESLYLSLQQRQSLVSASVVCPGMVRTNIGDIERVRPEALRNDAGKRSPEMEVGLAALKALIDRGMPPEQVAEVVFQAIREERFYILPHPEWVEAVQLRTDQLLRMKNPVNPAATIMKLLSYRP